jgi:hypothetical protein
LSLNSTAQINPGTYELHLRINHPASHQTTRQSVIFAVASGPAQTAS